jgi:hypothetical protein
VCFYILFYNLAEQKGVYTCALRSIQGLVLRKSHRMASDSKKYQGDVQFIAIRLFDVK